MSSEPVNGKVWLLIWSIIFCAIGAFVWLVFAGAMGNAEQRYYRLEAPGSMELPHLVAGRYTIFHEFDKSADSKEDLRPPGFERLAFTITPTTGGAALSVVPSDRANSFVIRRNVCEPVHQFEVTEPGGYRFNADYNSGQTGGTYRVVIGRPYYTDAVRNFTIGALILIAAGILVSWLLYKSGAVRPAPPSAEA